VGCTYSIFLQIVWIPGAAKFARRTGGINAALGHAQFVPLTATAGGWLLAGREPPAIARPAIEWPATRVSRARSYQITPN
jgi:hypothetical protein